MKKKLMIAVLVILGLIAGVFLARNFIVRKVLEVKLTEINKGKVDISEVDFSPFSKNIIIRGIDFTSRKNTLKNFVSIDKFEADYDIYFKDKKILISKAEFSGINFMTDRTTDGSIGDMVRDDETAPVEVPNLDAAKNSAVEDLEELISARANVSKGLIKDLIQAKYEDTEGVLNERKHYWEKRIKSLENTPDYKVIKDTYEKISKEKNPLQILRMEKAVRNAAHSFKNLSKELVINRETMKDEFQQIILNEDMDRSLESAVNEIVDRGQLIVLDLDSLVNFYLNDIYKESIDEFVERYRTLMKELELRRDEDMTQEDVWEFFAEEIVLKTELYGVVVEGQINNISSRLSKNLNDIDFSLKADSDKSHGEVDGVINLKRLEGDISIDISKFDFSDLEDLEVLHKYVISGQAGLKKNITLTRDNIYLKGDVYIHKMKLNGNEISQKLRIKNPFLKDMIIPLLSEVKVGNVKYKYSSASGKLELQSNLSQEIMKALNSEKGYMRDKITQDMLREGRQNLEQYRKALTTDNKKALEQLEGQFDEQSKYLDKIQDVLDKFNIKGEDDFTEKLIDKIFK
ncbi:hypothetical protein IX317_000982 [Fusobacterium sp. DD29]|uniref:hypothetical protein n=1 Tax=unclassified Fusobacterium TaxID=2648384 RepID=UPI001B8C6E2F|nr:MULTISPECIES: hypothetical protein [unclassified Fusobacterium]MBR8700934.1 hypothetical protein [Fusobacterium sp. DD45]MBR8710714.1 hypothetical protein [Fusobacterium sp. DD28]MBR8749317.1 hypothetical protein [Fusobacterium sp. DD29]MBR8751292.1 hypothetical protein [Fusobacterium sp. DD26]MBR8761585.1 hypothetical protein [Fusobacterium sp. DD25]